MIPHVMLEADVGAWAGYPPENVVACSSGTAALHLTLEALSPYLPLRSVVILPNFTMIACARAVSMADLTPIFIDCDPVTLNMDPTLVERAIKGYHNQGITGLPVIMAVHVYGRQCNMVALADIAARYGAFLIEDLAEAHGVKPHEMTDAACWSFYRNKVVRGEEGGAVAFKLDLIAERARGLRSLGFTSAHDFMHTPRGCNYRLADSLATMIRTSLSWYKRNVKSRKNLEASYDLHCPPEWMQPPRDVPWVYDIRIPGMTPDEQGEVVSFLQRTGIGARHAFKPMSFQPEYRTCKAYSHNDGTGPSNAARASDEVIYLPLTGPVKPALTFESIRYKLGR